ncbi:glycerol-3-phosphate dehydrogenase/oxidase [Asaia krungthepensis]|uniref:Glycerol-3-phosphate dehydrogenase n=1 Tax=Asaia krungthepensis NRIC 0535 TaxID=1307925 RepID=A0ABQ0PX27_9PROT|nr:glycerol-3-phosphate dehydrogenase/oxidase [Asaia krungthepensis]GBQ83768.1 glycerol-3-phosphate dehydrogenase [Asaia krungthepensis NRIC 0535]
MTHSATQLDSAHFDVTIIGAGINGVGLFRELAMQGINVLLIDRDDICAGASAAPSRLIHGGIKYLETGEFRLVAQSTLERNLLLRNAPHLVTPLPTVIPIHSWFGGIVPSIRRFLGRKAKLADRGVLITEIGMQIYDFLGRRARVMPRHKLSLGKNVRQDWPSITSKVIATGRYYDAAISQPERLGFECVEDALQLSLGCGVKTYTEIVSFDEGALAIKDRLTGNTETIRTDLIVNAGGAWIDRVNAQIGLNTRYIGGTKGSHLVIDHAELHRELNGQMVYFGTADGRICLVYPFLGHVLVGSTDIPITDPDTASCTDDEQAYMLRMVRELFPGLTIADGDVIYRYCGVRPLPASATDDPGAISRDHIIHTDYTGTTPVLSLVGGKWTTFRGLAEEVADKTLALLHRKRIASSRLRPIGGGARYPGPRAHDAYLRRLIETHSLSASRARSLFERYGTTAERIAAYCAATPDQPLASLPEYSRNEILYVASQELVRSVDDILFRRTSIALGGHLTQQVVEEVCSIMAPHMGWTDQESTSQAQTCWNKAKTVHGLRDASAS